MDIALEKRDGYASRSILSVLHAHPVDVRSKPLSMIYIIPSSVFVIISVVSLWAILFYAILGLCYYFNSGILLEDLNTPRLRLQSDLTLFTEEIFEQYHQLSFHCFFSVCLYLLVLFLSLFVLRHRTRRYHSYQDPK